MKYIIFVLLSISLLGCQQNKFPIHDEAIAKAGFNATDFKAVVVIPKEGCSGCISNVAFYLMGRIDQMQDTLIVFSKVDDIKGLKIKLGKEFIEHPKVNIDDKNVFSHTELSSIYPQVWDIKEGKVITVKDFDPAV